MSKQKSNKRFDTEKATPISGVTANSKNDAKNDTKHNVDV